jgi:hypothetical protein
MWDGVKVSTDCFDSGGRGGGTEICFDPQKNQLEVMAIWQSCSGLPTDHSLNEATNKPWKSLSSNHFSQNDLD